MQQNNQAIIKEEHNTSIKKNLKKFKFEACI